MKAPISILLVDDSKTVRDTVEIFLRDYPSMVVTGTAEDGQEALEVAERVRPDLVLMDLRMPRMDGLAATRALKAQPSPPKVIILSFDDDGASRSAVTAAGADGFCSKLEAPGNLVPAILALFPELAASGSDSMR